MVIRKIIALIVGLLVYLTQKRLGMAIVAFLVVDFLLEQKLAFDIKSILYVIVSIALFFIGHRLSLWFALFCVAPMGEFAWTFTGGFIGGVIELETYLWLVLFSLKLLTCKNIGLSLRYMVRPAIICFFVGGIIQGSYMVKWQNLFYV